MTSRLNPLLRRLALRRGLQLSFVDTLNRTVVAEEESVRAVLAAMGDEVDSDARVEASLDLVEARDRQRLIEPVIVSAAGAPLRVPLCRAPGGRLEMEVSTEAGEVLAGLPRVLESPSRIEWADQVLSPGYYDLVVRERGETHRARILAAPAQVFRHQPLRRRWGLFAPLYAIRGRHDRGIGEYTDLRELLRFAGESGAACVGTLPLYSTFLDTQFDPSPYAPVSRLFWNEAFLTVEELEGAASTSRMVDWRGVAKRKLESTLPHAQRAFDDAETRALIHAFERDRPLARLYGAFRTRVEMEGGGWRSWSDASPESVERLADTPLARWFRWAQWRCESEIESLSAAGAGLYLDFPLGSNSDGFDVWYWRDLYVDGATIGAPPDLAYRQGQDWGFRPPHPETMRLDGWRHWRDLIRRAMQPASMLRLDHVMGLHRMWWVPAGLTSDHGLYVHYRSEELYAILAIESHRARCSVVGEDLGTVPPAVTGSMKKHGVLGMWALIRQLTHATDDHGLAPIESDRVASIGTHDMPPFAAFLRSDDIEEKGVLGVIEPGRLDEERAKRPRILKLMHEWLTKHGAWEGSSDPAALLEAVLVALASSPAPWVIVNMEDLWLETVSQNIPTTTTERPNWRPRLALSLDQMENDPRVRRLLGAIGSARDAAGAVDAG